MEFLKKGCIVWEGLVEVDWDCGHWRGSAVSLWSLRGSEKEVVEKEIQEKGRVQV